MEENKEKVEVAETEEEIKEPECEAAEEETEKEDDELSLALKAAAEYKDKFLRVSAEYDNFRKRTQKEKESLFSDGKAACAASLLPLADNMERALAAADEDSGADGILEGLKMISKQLSDIFKSLSIEEIPAKGEQFDPELHNAVMHIEDEAVDDNTVVEEFQKGYMMDGKVLRHSMVKVAN
ncbi:MAG: nucleotide exchange factor GrpE [Clostridia bacterium]|nr:nucleotide exchange factor GrpE [Clostridia bacterium]